MGFKLKNSRRFLSEGDKVKISVIFRGREIAHTDRGIRILAQMAEALGDVGTVEQAPKLEGRNMFMLISPK
jgi:translation initiation factor IF-3